jgi:hypothetical protein
MNLLSTPPSPDFADPMTADASLDDASAASLAPTAEPDAGPEVTPTQAPAHFEIAVEAYTRYLERGARDGHAVEDWLEAERTILTRRARKG